MAPLPVSVKIGIVAVLAFVALAFGTYWFFKTVYGTSGNRPDEFPPAHGRRRRKPPGAD